MIREEDIREVRDRTDVVELVGERTTLRRKGRLFWGLCPFHQEKTPSFKVDPESGLYHCFGCGEGGDAFGFLMKTEGLDFVDAVRLLAERCHFELRDTAREARGPARGRLLEAHDRAERFYSEALMRAEDASQARDYLASRGFHSDAARRFGLGWSPGGDALVKQLSAAGFSEAEVLAAGLAVRSQAGRLSDRFRRRLMFPIRDTAGRVVAFGGRVLDDGQPKYLNSADSPLFRKSRVLYALDAAKEAIGRERTAVVVEGYTDVIAAHIAGFSNVVATLGTAFTEEHLRLLARFADRVVLVFDADEAGLAAADRTMDFAGRYGLAGTGIVARIIDEGKLDVRVAVLPQGKDPADLLSKDPGAFGAALEKAEPLVDFALERRISGHDLSTLAGRLDAARDALRVLAGVESPVAMKEHLELLATRLQLETHALEAELARAGKKRPVVADGAKAAAPPAVSGATGPAGPPASDVLLERQALAALIKRPALLAAWESALGEDLFSEEVHVLLWRELEASSGREPSELARLFAGRPEVASVLADIISDDAEAEGLADDFADIVGRLKDFALRRQIEDAKARLMSAERAGEPIDGLQADLWELQRERHRWRRPGQHGSDERSEDATTEDE